LTGKKESDPTANPEFKRVLGNLLRAPPKPHSEMKIGKPKPKGRRAQASKKVKPK
jgi:hypothetical protein